MDRSDLDGARRIAAAQILAEGDTGWQTDRSSLQDEELLLLSAITDGQDPVERARRIAADQIADPTSVVEQLKSKGLVEGSDIASWGLTDAGRAMMIHGWAVAHSPPAVPGGTP